MNNMGDIKNVRLFNYLTMVCVYESDDGWFYLDKINNSDRILVEDLLTLIGDVIRDGITSEVQREVLNKFENFYHYNNSIIKNKNQ